MKLLKMSALVIVTALLCIVGTRWYYVGRVMPRSWKSNSETPYYRVKQSIFESMPRNEGAVVFLGDSLTEYARFEELVPEVRAYNRGIAGDTTYGVLNRLDEVISLKPSKLFILIGTNDVVFGITTEETAANLREIIRRVKENSPSTKIYLETLMPINPSRETRRPAGKINAINANIRAIAEDTGVELVDINSHMAGNGILPEKWTADGLHLNGAGVVRWVEFLRGVM